MTYKEYLRKLRSARTQEDVDDIVRSAHQCLSATEFGRFLPKVREHRNKLREKENL